MKMLSIILMAAALLGFKASVAHAANPSFSSFNGNQFNTTGNQVSIKNGVLLTNVSGVGQLYVLGDGGLGAPLLINAPHYSGATPIVNMLQVVNTDSLEVMKVDTNMNLTLPGEIYSLSLTATNGLTNLSQTASTVVAHDANKKMVSIANGTGALTNNGSGVFGWFNLSGVGGGSTSTVTSVTVPMGAWFANYVGDGATIQSATLSTCTNAADSYIFTDAVTNAIRTRLALPYDWDAGTVQLGLQALCTATNHSSATKTVWSVRATALGDSDNDSSLTWGTAVRVTNDISTAAYIQKEAITGNVTVGNTPTTAKSILWEIQRQGADSGDTMTNASVMLVEVRIYHKRNFGSTFPTASP